MKKSDIEEIIKNSIPFQFQISIARNKIDSNRINGIPLKLGKYLLLIEYLYDF